ncbi:MAG: hypothetical protein H6737_27515 [Alphaproteobacteria bacterium]|nr:hypothetical protein [Alphaproteobacteria bacterium]
MRAASLLLVALGFGCMPDEPPAPARTVTVEVIGDGPVDRPRRHASTDAWLIALDALNASPEPLTARNAR